MSTTKTYAQKSGLVKACKKLGVTCNPRQNVLGRWYNLPMVLVNAVRVPVLKVATAPAKIVKVFGKGIKIEKNRAEQNGIKKPSVGGKCRAVWDECDRLLNANNGIIPMPKALKEWALTNGYNENNAVIELYQWRKFMGFTKQKA